jgi:signal peptidase I
MQCPSCDLDNLPGSIRCYDCGYQFSSQDVYFKALEDAIKTTSVFQRWLRTLPLPRMIIEGEFYAIALRLLLLPFVWIPGLVLWAMDYYERGLSYLVLTIGAFILGITLFNHWLSNWLLPLGGLIYIWSMVDGFYTWQERHYPVLHSMEARIKTYIFIVFSITVLALLWAPQLQFLKLSQPGYQPYLNQGDYLLINSNPKQTKTFRTMDLVAITYDKQTTFGRLVGMPEQTVYFDGDKFYAQAAQLNWGIEKGDAQKEKQKFEIPSGNYLVLTQLSGSHLKVWDKCVIIPTHDIIGRVEAIASPTERRGRIQ